MRSLAILILTAAVALSAAAPLLGVTAAQDTVSGPDLAAARIAPNDCAFLMQLGDDPRPRLGAVTCGTLDVPEDWSRPDGRRIQIGYVVLHSTGEHAAPDPVVYLEGGPGGSALTGIEFLAQLFAGMRQQRDIIIFDQRGTRLSSPLRCESVSAAAAIDARLQDPAPDVAGTPAAQPAARFPDELGDPFEIMQMARQEHSGAAVACAREIAASGVDLRHYNSIASANDTVALVKALGYDAYNLYGISYGTRLALVIMREHPASGIRGVVLDSAFPPEINGFERYPEEPHEVVIQLFADCAIDPACSAAYPDLKTRFVALLTRLRDEPVISDDGIPITDRDLIGVMQALSQQVDAVPYVPLMIAELERGEDAAFIGIASGAIPSPASSDEALTDADVAAAPAATSATPLPRSATNVSPARNFLITFQAQMDPLPVDDTNRALSLLLHLDTRPPERATLAALVEQAFPPSRYAEAYAALMAQLEDMSEEDVGEVFVVVEETITFFDFLTFRTTRPQFHAVECNEEVPFQAFENAVTTARQLEIPELALGVVDAMAAQFAICEVWPSGRAPAVEELPVTSDIPTLVMAGAYDLQTPVSWNKSAFVTLPNGVFIEFPMSGHGVITYSACAERVATEFIADPAVIPDTSCVADLKPQWVLPTADDAAAGDHATPVTVSGGSAVT